MNRKMYLWSESWPSTEHILQKKGPSQGSSRSIWKRKNIYSLRLKGFYNRFIDNLIDMDTKIITKIQIDISIILFQTKRFKTYVYLLRAKMASYPEYEPSLVETAIGEVDEPPSSPASNRPPMEHHVTRPVQRSMSDRYSYRAAIYSQRDYETDLV